ncbi:hypothetical protein ACH4E7_06930 [Kitasatospora sp. NPDC018058]|uniref:hypothetical protein n=1 Tax=Kitasatospora sp. NPDC018058 TaxID=3364025 RepID=UPI0037BEBFC0
METPPWRDRVRREDELLEQLGRQVVAASQRRSAALADGVAELGSVYKVANELGRSWQAIDKAIKKYRPTTA